MIRDDGNGYVTLKGPGDLPELALVGRVAGWDETPCYFRTLTADGRCQWRARFHPAYPVVREEAVRGFPPAVDETIALGAGFPLLLSFYRPCPGGWVGDVAYLVWRLLERCGVRVCTVPPDARPGRWGEVKVVPPNTWMGGAGVTPATWFHPTDLFLAQVVYCTAMPDPAQTAVLAVHEFLHACGEPHTSIPGDVMVPNPGPTAKLTEAAVLRTFTKTRAYR